MSSSHEFARPVSGELFLVMELVVCVHAFGGQCKHKGLTPSFLLCRTPLTPPPPAAAKEAVMNAKQTLLPLVA